ncbi:hypothetical protein BDW69DRAFT_178508 [Aspergillus filifer]
MIAWRVSGGQVDWLLKASTAMCLTLQSLSSINFAVIALSLGDICHRWDNASRIFFLWGLLLCKKFLSSNSHRT